MIQIVSGLLITLVSASISVYEKWKNKNEPDYRKKNNISLSLLFIALVGAFLSFFGGIDAIKQKKKSEIAASKRQERIDSQNTTIYNLEKLNHDLIIKDVEYSRRLDSSSYENYLLTKDIIKQTKDLKAYETGEGSFCYFYLGNRGPTLNSYRFVLYSSGVNPMDNVIARIADVFNLQSTSPDIYIHIGKIYPKEHTARFFETSYTPIKKDSIWLNIFFQSGSREIVEELKEIRINDKWKVSLTVYEGKKVIFKKIDKDFPKGF